jgi:hypothetical protein
MTNGPSNPRDLVSITPDTIQAFYSQAIGDFLAKMDRAIAAGEDFLENWEFNAQTLPDLRQDANRSEMPQPVLDAFDYYATEVMDQDWGVVFVATVPIADQSTYVVRVMTDGDDGWLEIFNEQGEPIGTGRTNEGLTYWGDCTEIRAQVQSGDIPEPIMGGHRG